MDKKYCKKVRLSAMAVSDNETPLLAIKEIEKHIASCHDCQLVIEQLQETANYLNGKERRSYDVSMLEAVESALQEVNTIKEDSKYLIHFIILGLILIILKIIGVSPVFSSGVIVKVVPVFIIITFFVLIKQNPFSIKHNLQMKGD
jgi:hypothetical protein